MAPRVGPVPTMPVSTRGRHLMMMMMLVVVLVMMLVMLVMMLGMMLRVMLMALVAVTMSGIKLRQRRGRRWRTPDWLAGHEGHRCWRQSRGGIGVSLPWLRGLELSGVLRQKLWRGPWHEERFPTHDHLLGRG